MGTIIGTIIRMSRYSTSEDDLISSIYLTIKELITLKYTHSFIKKTLIKIYRKNPTNWEILPKIYNKL